MFIPRPTIDAILALPIEAVIGEYVKLKREGAGYKGSCPFHNEKTASFSVSPVKKMFYCFGCHEGGNVIQFVMKHLSLPFPDAAKAICDRHGITIENEKSDNIRKVAIKSLDDALPFEFKEIKLSAELLRGVISAQVWKPLKDETFDTRYDKIIAVCKEYGFRALGEYSFTKTDDDGTHHKVTIRATATQPVFMFSMEEG